MQQESTKFDRSQRVPVDGMWTGAPKRPAPLASTGAAELLHRRAATVGVALLALLGVGLAPVAAAGEERPPNILLILTDDQGNGDYGFMGHPHLKTPGLDRLAAESARFANFYTAPVCSPTRAGLLTGRYSYRGGVWGTHSGFETLRLDEVTLAEVLSERGYRTGIFGKWHLGTRHPWTPSNQGFHEGLFSRTGGLGMFDATLERLSDTRDPEQRQEVVPGYLNDALTSEAIAFMEKHRSQPFFCYLPYLAVHIPHQAKPAHRQSYLDQGLDGRSAELYGMLASVDENVGRLLAALDRLELAKTTIVLFMSDNGGDRPHDRFNGNLRGHKGQVYEGGIRSPLLFRYSDRVKAGRVIDTPVSHIDLFPTLLELCGVGEQSERPPTDGLSLVPLLREQSLPPGFDTRILFNHWHSMEQPDRHINSAARGSRYKMVNGTELYDLQADPAESRDLADRHPDILRDLNAHYEDWWQDVTAERGFTTLPTYVGHPDESPTYLLAWNARCEGTARVRGAHDGHGDRYLRKVQNWRSVDDVVRWDVEVITPGTYEVALRYRCLSGLDGATVKLRAGDRTLSWLVVNRLPNVEGSTLIELSLGRLEVGAGVKTIEMQAISIPFGHVMDLERLVLRSVSETPARRSAASDRR